MFHIVVKDPNNSQVIFDEYNTEDLIFDIKFENKKLWIIVVPYEKMGKINLKIYKSNNSNYDQKSTLISDVSQNFAYLQLQDTKSTQDFNIIATKEKVNTNLQKSSLIYPSNIVEKIKDGSSFKELSKPILSSRSQSEIIISPQEVQVPSKKLNKSENLQIEEIVEVPSKRTENFQEEEDEQEYVCTRVNKDVVGRKTIIIEKKGKKTETYIEEEIEEGKPISFKIKK